jgi:hypothetical protein
MNDTCSKVETVLAASRRGRLTSADEEHVAGCSYCSDALLLDPLLREEGLRACAAAVPPASHVVSRQVRQRLAEEGRRRARRLLIGLRVAGACLSALGCLGAAAWGGLLYGKASVGWLGGLVGQLDPSALLTLPTNPASLLTAIAGVGLSVLTYGLWSSWVEE